ncbi:hypothetical protein F994_00173 [Acinetobacter bohemicus ANC 3994]|uniref:Mobilization protein n=1 Tax=Acinetobacter bohemicus ANC 3994 TaxID=1217715 RepID=N8QJ22_9GAMM|nr:hypothetical protein [Acinetobacter bohemicus]ENU21299.1 hypothetical protein F994_00173 [Acinetobacter bohemicus ANC 3994]
MSRTNIDEQLILINEQKKAQLEKLTQLKNREKDLRAQQRKKERDLTRQQDTRLKIILGSFYLRQFKQNPALLESIKNDLVSFASEPEGKAKEQNLTVLKELLNIEDPNVELLHSFWKIGNPDFK